jgi:hypothetical protein
MRRAAPTPVKSTGKMENIANGGKGEIGPQEKGQKPDCRPFGLL